MKKNTGTQAGTIVAPCGCEQTGRFYTAADCTVLDLATCTGHERMTHATAALKLALKKHREIEVT